MDICNTLYDHFMEFLIKAAAKTDDVYSEESKDVYKTHNFNIPDIYNDET